MRFESTEETELVLQATEKVLRRLLRFLIGRVTFKRFSLLARQVFVEESEKQLRKENPGKQIPLTQLALLTGLDTRVLAKIKNDPEFAHPSASNSKYTSILTPEANLIDTWLADPRFFDKKREKPKVLNIWGRDSSFEALFHDSISARGITIQSVLQRLSSNHSISIDKKKQTVQLTAAFWEPFKHGDAAAAFEVGFNAVCGLIDTVIHNFSAVKNGAPTFYQRSFRINRLDPEDIEKFRETLKDFLVEVGDDSIKAMQVYEKKISTRNNFVGGVGLHYFEEMKEG